MNKENSHVESFLNYYCNLEKSPGYAVMLHGKPGVGKTWLICQYREKLKQQGQKSLYVSLYGLNSFADIENSIFEQLHPALAQEGLGLSARILKDAIRSTINLELKCEKLDIQASSRNTVPEYLANTKEYLLIFDDLDRCYLSIPEFFGYINFLLEHHGFRIILVANEAALKLREDNHHIEELVYQKVKDKVVGRSFEVKPDFVEAFAHVLTLLKNKDLILFLSQKKDLVKEVFISSKPANLRHLQHCLLDFERLFCNIPEEKLKNHNFLKHLLIIFLIFGLEIRSNNISPIDLKGLRLKFHSELFSKVALNDKKNPQTYILDKYKKFKSHDTIFSEDWWIKFFTRGEILPEEIAKQLENSHFFFSENTPGIIQISELWDLTDEQFVSLQKKVMFDFSSQKYNDVGAIKLTVSFLLWASNLDLINKSKTEILNESIKYVESKVKNGTLVSETAVFTSEIDINCWQGIPFFTVEMPEFKEFCRFLESQLEKILKMEISKEAQKILEILKNDPERFSGLLTFSSKMDKAYNELPVLSFLSPAEFFEAFLRLSPEYRLLISQSLKERYFLAKSKRMILPEASWLKTLIDMFKEKAHANKGNLSCFILSTIAEKFFEPSLECLEILQMERIE